MINTNPPSSRSGIFNQSNQQFQQSFVYQNQSSFLQQQQQQQQQQTFQYPTLYSGQQQQQNQMVIQQQLQQYQQQQLQSNPDQQQQQQQQQVIDPNAPYSNYAQYGQQQQYQYQLPPDDYTNPEAIPQKIDLQFYGIIDKKQYIKAYLVLRLQNQQILYHYNHQQKNIAENEAKIIAKNFYEYQQIQYDSIYQVSTEEGYWIMNVTDLDRVYQVFFDQNFRKDLAYFLFKEFYTIITEQLIDPIKIENNNTDLANNVNQNLQLLTEQYEQKLLENWDNKQILDYEITQFQQNYFQIGLSKNCLINSVQLIKERIIQKPNTQIIERFNIFSGLFDILKPFISICICILLAIIVIILLYHFIIKDSFIQQQQTQQSIPQKHLLRK